MSKKAPDSVKRSECPDNFVVKKAGGAVFLEGYFNRATVDRANEIIEPEGWDLENFKKNPIILFNHGMDFDFGGLPVGKAVELRVDDNGLWGKVRMSNSKTDRISAVRDLVQEGILKAFSVGFDPKDVEPSNEEGTPTKIKHSELYECSIVGIPMHQDSLGEVSEKALKAINVLEIYKQKEEENGDKEEEEENEDDDKKQAGSGTTPEAEGHTHGFSVDESGNGKTTSTSEEPNHTHKISEYVVGDYEGHTHGKVTVSSDEKSEEEREKEAKEKDFQECVAEKIPKLIDEGMDQDQAVAVAISYCQEKTKCEIPNRGDYEKFFEIADNYVEKKQAEQDDVGNDTTPVQTGKTDDDFGSPYLDQQKQSNVLLGSLISEIQGLRADIRELNKSQPPEEVEEKTTDELKESDESSETKPDNNDIDGKKKDNDNNDELDIYMKKLDYCKQRLQKLGY